MNVQVYLNSRVESFNLAPSEEAGIIGAADSVVVVSTTGDVGFYFAGDDNDRVANIDAIVNALQRCRLGVIKRMAKAGGPSNRAEVVHERLIEGLPSLDILDDPEVLVPALRSLGFNVLERPALRGTSFAWPRPSVVGQAPDVDAPDHNHAEDTISSEPGCPRCEWDRAQAALEEPFPHIHADVHLTRLGCPACEAEIESAEASDHARERNL